MSPVGAGLAWLGVIICSCIVLGLALALTVVCHPPFLERLPPRLREVFRVLAEVGKGAFHRTSLMRTAADGGKARGDGYGGVGGDEHDMPDGEDEGEHEVDDDDDEAASAKAPAGSQAANRGGDDDPFDTAPGLRRV